MNVALPLTGLANQNFGDTKTALSGTVYLDRESKRHPRLE